MLLDEDELRLEEDELRLEEEEDELRVLLGRLYEEPEVELLLREVLRAVEPPRELPPVAVLRLTDEDPVLRRTTSFSSVRLPADERTVLLVTTRAEVLRLDPLSMRRSVPVRDDATPVRDEDDVLRPVVSPASRRVASPVALRVLGITLGPPPHPGLPALKCG